MAELLLGALAVYAFGRAVTANSKPARPAPYTLPRRPWNINEHDDRIPAGGRFARMRSPVSTKVHPPTPSPEKPDPSPAPAPAADAPPPPPPTKPDPLPDVVFTDDDLTGFVRVDGKRYLQPHAD